MQQYEYTVCTALKWANNPRFARNRLFFVSHASRLSWPAESADEAVAFALQMLADYDGLPDTCIRNHRGLVDAYFFAGCDNG